MQNSAISPNNDGHNDLLELQEWEHCVTEFSISIYDRWGEKVFSATGGPASGWETLAWDGTYKDKFINPGVFVYYINAAW